MADISIKHLVVGPVATNCYIVQNTKTKEAVIIDPGAHANRISGEILDMEAKPVAILLTHGHFDHASAAESLAEEYEVDVYAHEKEHETLEKPLINLSGMMGASAEYHADKYVRDNEELLLAGLRIKVLHTPGHTVGGACYYLEEEGILFSGDTLFCQSVGRTDFPLGSAATLVRSIQEKLMVLPDEIKVYPGHDSETTIGEERKYNPYL